MIKQGIECFGVEPSGAFSEYCNKNGINVYESRLSMGRKLGEKATEALRTVQDDLSDAWAEWAERGRWPEDVRPFTKNRRHVVRKVWEK